MFPQIDENTFPYKLAFVGHGPDFPSFPERKLSPCSAFGNHLGRSFSVSLHSVFHRLLIKATGGPQIGLIQNLPALWVNELVLAGEGVGCRTFIKILTPFHHPVNPSPHR
jgi:hypothetical protein